MPSRPGETSMATFADAEPDDWVISVIAVRVPYTLSLPPPVPDVRDIVATFAGSFVLASFVFASFVFASFVWVSFSASDFISLFF
jgi:hypothetical protein